VGDGRAVRLVRRDPAQSVDTTKWPATDWGIRSSRWEDLYIVSAWRRFLTEPDSYFRHLLAD
jgi:hypothetical protein